MLDGCSHCLLPSDNNNGSCKPGGKIYGSLSCVDPGEKHKCLTDEYGSNIPCKKSRKW